MNIEDAYRILGLKFGARYEEVKSAYRSRARETHPDVGGKPQDFIQVQAAYEIICDYLGQEKESCEIPIPPELNWLIDRLLSEYQAEMSKQRAACRSIMNDLQRRLKNKVEIMSRRDLSKFNQYFRQEWNCAVRAIRRSANSSFNRIKNEYESWFDDSVGEIHERIERERFSQYVRSTRLAVQSSMPLLLCIAIAIVLHSKGSVLLLLLGSIFSIVFSAMLISGSFCNRYKKPSKVEALDIAPFRAGRSDIMSYSSEIVRSDIRLGRVAGAGGFILGDIVSRGIAGPILGGLMGWGAVNIISRILNPTHAIKASIVAEIDEFFCCVTPELERYIMEAQRGVYSNLRDKIIRNYKARIQKITRMLSGSVSSRADGLEEPSRPEIDDASLGGSKMTGEKKNTPSWTSFLRAGLIRLRKTPPIALLLASYGFILLLSLIIMKVL